MSVLMFEKICATWCPREILDALIELAVEIAREGPKAAASGRYSRSERPTLFSINLVL